MTTVSGALNVSDVCIGYASLVLIEFGGWMSGKWASIEIELNITKSLRIMIFIRLNIMDI